MAITDYEIYKDMYYVDKTRVPDGTGGFEYVYTIGQKFKASCVKSSTNEQILAGVRGSLFDQYSLTTEKNNAISQNDIIMFYSQSGERIYLRVTSEPQYTPKSSSQNKWKGFTASVFEPDIRVVN